MNTTKLLVLGVLLSSSYAAADNSISVDLNSVGLVQSVSLAALSQASVVAQTPVAVSATLATRTQTAQVLAQSLLPTVTVTTTGGAISVGTGGVGTASVTGIQSANAFTVIPVVSVGVLAVVPAVTPLPLD